MPDLPEAAMEQIVSIIKQNLHGGSYTVDHPHMSLEDFFLDVVNKAKRESVETSGATSGGEIAEYLSGDAVDAKEKLEVLAGLKTPEPPKPEISEAPKIDTERLTSLETEEKAVEEKPEPEAMDKENLEEANKKLMAILSAGKDE